MIAVALISLIILLPFYIADAYAGGVSVTRSSGAGNVDNYFKGENDNWIIQADANLNGRAVQPDYLTLLFPSPKKFRDCSSSVFGYTCAWESGMMSAAEGKYEVEVELSSAGETYTDTASLIIDGTAPKILALTATQEDSMIRIHYDVTDSRLVKGAETSSGLDKIEFYDGTSLLGTAQLAGYSDEGEELISAGTAGSGQRNIIVKIYDRLGHIAVVSSDSFGLDLSIPQIDEGSFLIGRLKEYASSSPKKFDISVNISEDEGLARQGSKWKVIGDFTDMGLSDSELADECALVDVDVYNCVWRERIVSIVGVVDAVVTAEDVSGNIGKKTISRTYVVDSTAPEIMFVGTTAFYNGNSYVIRQGTINRFKAQMRDYDSGISPEGVKLDLHSVNPALSSPVEPYECVQDAATDLAVYSCYWNVSVASVGTISLISVEDDAGNSVGLTELTQKGKAAVVKDEEAPVITSVSVVSLGGTGIEPRTYFQSHDYIRITVNATDDIGVNGYADLRHVINGGNAAAEGTCTEVGDGFTCVWDGVGDLRNGYIKVPVYVTIEDLVGNKETATEEIEILEISGDTDYDYWSLGEIKAVPAAVDRQTTDMIAQRVYFEVPIHTTYNYVQALSVELIGCSGDTIDACSDDCIQNAYMINNFAGTDKPYVVVELEPFDSTNVNATLNYECSINIYSQIREAAAAYPETESFNATVGFFNLPLGVVQSNLQLKINKEREEIKTGFYGVIGGLNEFFFWIKWSCNLLMMWQGIKNIWDLVTADFDSLRTSVFGIPVAQGQCFVKQGVDELIVKNLWYYLKKFCDLATCRHDFGMQVWGDTYKKYSGYAQFGVAPDKYDNLVIAVATLCVPAIIHNLEKLRQIKCRYVYCLENEIPAGTATLQTCRELKQYQSCKYVYGNLFQLIPFVGVLNAVLTIVKNALMDPVGIFRMTGALACGLWCPTSNTGQVLCSIGASLTAVADLIQDIAVLAQQPEQIKKDYCSEIGL